MTQTPSSTTHLPRLRLAREGDITRLTFPRNAVDGIAVREMYETVAELFEQPHLKLLIDFTGVPMLSSGAMGMLVTLRKKLLQSGGQLHILIPDANVRQTLQIMNLHLVLTIFEDAGPAVQFKP